jgi:phenylacetate-coenzyme A ligase PaaK-like adenylate-forming protein
MYQAFSRHYFDYVNRYRNWDYRGYLRDLEVSQWQPQEVVERENLKKLRSLLHETMLHVPYYRDEWKKMGFELSDIKSIADLADLPVITKVDLRRDYDQFKNQDISKYDVWPSSGSTGSPFHFRMDKHTIAANSIAALLRGKGWWGFEHGMPEGMIWAGGSNVNDTFAEKFFAARKRLSWGLKNICLIDIYSLDEKSIRQAYHSLLKHAPVVLRCISSGLYRFCFALEELGLDGRQLGIKGAIYTGETLPEAQKRLIERVLGCRAICEYGCVELGIIGFECPQGNIHISHENMVVEYLKDGAPAAPGEIAEIVVTDLNNFVSPLIRYSVGDFVVPTNTACACGRTLPVIKSIEGRLHDEIIAANGTVIHGLFFTHIFDRKEFDAVHQFQVVQQSSDNLTINVISTLTVDESVLAGVRKVVEGKMGAGVNIDVRQVDELDQAKSGKTPWIISKMVTR